jgi:hypothetical protein
MANLMNDWEIGGTQNPWVCPSDRHLQLRAQLKSGWSVRTASARSPTNIKQNAGGGISDAEQEQIRKVLARADAGRQNEQQRIGKMVDRLEKMRTRATGNGVTQCLLCQTEFGLLASKSYAAMCMDCRKYVCQKNCGVETYDQKRGEPIFLCKICSEYREVMWKKSGAWFYKEMPAYVKPSLNGTTPASNSCSNTPRSFWQHQSDSRTNLTALSPTAAFSSLSLQDVGVNPGVTNNGISTNNAGSSNASFSSQHRVSRQLPIPPDQQQRLKTTPRPRITPSWVHEKVQSSMSIGSEDEESSSSSIDHVDFKQTLPSSTSTILARRHHHFHRPKELNNRFPESVNSLNSRHSTHQHSALSSRNQITDTDSDNDESRRSTPSTSPRHSLATPSSYGGDDLSQNHVSLAANNEASDVKSIDSGVVQSDHSAQQAQLHQSSSVNLTLIPQSDTISPPHVSYSSTAMPTSSSRLSASEAQMNKHHPPSIGPTPPPIPPRAHTSSPSHFGERCTSSASSASSSAMFHQNPPYFPTMPIKEFPSTSQKNNINKLSHESLHSISAKTAENRSRPESAYSTEQNPLSSSVMSDVEKEKLFLPESGESSSIKIEETTSPTFMSSPDDDTSTLGSIQFNLTYLHEDKQLIIHLIRAKNLKAMDKNGFSDPYVKFHIIPGNAKATKLTSKTIEKTLNPEWHEELIYYGITEEDRLKKTLRITVLDRDRIGSDFLGETRVALKKLPLGQMKKFNLYLEHAMPTPMEKPEEVERGKILISICYNIQQGSLFVNIKRCAELLGMDSTGFSDPYCKVSLTPLSSKAHRQKTAIKKRTLNPEFNEILQFIVPFKDLPKKTLEIGVYDHDVGRHDDYIGGIVLSTAAKSERGQQWSQCIENPGKTFEAWHKLDPNT